MLLQKNGDKPLPPMGHHITANGDEIINTPARLGVDKSLGNVLRWPDEFYEARAAGSLAKIERRPRCHRWSKLCQELHNAVPILHIPMLDFWGGVVLVVKQRFLFFSTMTITHSTAKEQRIHPLNNDEHWHP